MSVKEFGVGFRDHEESYSDHGSGFVNKWMLRSENLKIAFRSERKCYVLFNYNR